MSRKSTRCRNKASEQLKMAQDVGLSAMPAGGKSELLQRPAVLQFFRYQLFHKVRNALRKVLQSEEFHETGELLLISGCIPFAHLKAERPALAR